MIAIRLVSRAGESLGSQPEAIFGAAGGDIGRGAECTLVLSDPERRISRKHLQVTCREGHHYVRLISTNLMVELDGVPLAPGIEYPLKPEAEIRVGPFLLKAGGETMPTAAEDDLGFRHPVRPVGRPSVFHDLLHAVEPQGVPVGSSDIDLVVGDPTGFDQPQAPGAADSAGREEASQDPVPADKLIDALYAGLGIESHPSARTPAQMHLIGTLLRAAVDGTLSLLAARSIAKRELGANPTLPQVRENNPLKFSPDVDAALEHLLGPTQRGFIAPLTAVHEAFDDLRAHEVAVLAGTRAALEAVLASFNPHELEQRLVAKGVWNSLLPVNRRAKLWERYAQQHADILREVEEDFDSIFGHAFLRAYKAQSVPSLSPSPAHDRREGH